MKLGLIISLWLISIEDSASGLEVRLVGGISKFEGRVEVYYNQLWGTVCDDWFDNLDAQVFCSMLGFERNGARAVLRAFYGEGNGTIWLDDLDCDGTENSVEECDRNIWGDHNCGHIEDAGIDCKPIDIRLTGGAVPYEGRIEVFHSQNWGTVCDNNFGTFQAQVLCQMLGYPREGAVAYNSAYFGKGSGSVWLSYIDCEVQDPHFLNCRNISLLPSICDHTKDVGIRCKPRVRLVGGPSVYEGRVEVLYSNRWATVCDKLFDTSDAQVFCHMLGYKRHGTIENYGPGNGTVLLSGLKCSGTENSVDECSRQDDIVSNPPCPHTSDVGIKCQPETGCSSLSPVNNGKYLQSSCTVSTSPVGFNCLLICFDGFKQSEYQSTRCLATGIWDVSDVLLTCEDVNECVDNPCNESQICENKPGTFDCRCNEGYTRSLDNETCIDIYECDFNNGGCGNTCTNEIGAFVCSCKQGYFLLNDRLSCSDIDECNIDNGDCEQQCINAEGSYLCGCNHGYFLQNDSHSCADVNECELDNRQCDQICNNTEGSFFCDCNVGYEKENDISCIDLNECIADNGGCHHLCRNEIGSYSCGCDQGYFLQNDLTTCEDVNECDLNNGNCEQICTNGNGTFSCGCFSGYALHYDNRSCIDIDECDISNGGCEQICSNENGSYSCNCTDGYILETNTFSCKDIDECLTNNGGCSQKCSNVAGNFFCSCEKGYYLENDTFTCSDVDECEINNGDCDQLCKNFIGFYSCDCEKGFTLNIDNVSCDDITECDTNNGGCQQICTNLKGSFICSCTTGHILNKDGFSCKNVLQNSVSSSLNVLTDARKVTTLQDPITYQTFTEHLKISLQTYFKNYTFLPFSIVLQQIREQRNVSEQENKASVIINYTIVYDNEAIPTIRDNLIRGTFGFNVWTPFTYNGERMMVKLVNEVPTILPIRLVTNITEDAPVGTVVGEFTVHDPDDDERGEISVYSDDKPKEITFSPIVNERVQLVLEGKLDADKYRDDVEQGKAGPVLNFTVMVKDKPGLVASANVSLMIFDVNDNSPTCNPSGVTVKIPRDSQISMNIFKLDTVCRDKDYFYKDAIYVIEDDICSAFGIHTSGELYVNGEILNVFSSCMVTVNVTDMYNPLYSTKLDVTIEFFECPLDVDHLHTIWQRGIPGRIMYGQCPEGYMGEVTRFCDKDGVYHDPVYNCTKREIAEIFEKVNALNENTSASDVLEELANVTTTAYVNKSLLVGDLEAVNIVMSKLTEIIEVKPENIERIADSFIETANNILDESTTTSWTSKMNQTGSGADIVLENLDNFVEKIANVSTTTGKLKVKKSNLYLAVGTVGDCEGNEIQFPKRTDGDVPEWAEKTLDRVQMPCSEKMPFKSYSSVLYRNLSKILPSTSVNKSTADRQLNGPVMSFTYFPKPEKDLDSPIELTFQLYNSSLEKPVCSFWSKSDSSTGAWSSAGCWLDRFTIDKKTVVCKCNHLTNFAVLMSPSPFVSPDHHAALSTISMIGCILSMFCLASTIGIYGFFWRTVKSEKSIMNVNLCCVLFVAYLVFLVGVNKTENENACTAVAVLLHLVYLIVFFIMLSEGLMLANTVLYPFSTRKPGVPLLIASYVMAVLIVAISTAAVKLQGYGGEQSCWLSTYSGLVWAFLVPVLLIIAINITIVTLVIRKLFTTAAMSKKTDKEKAKAGVRSIIILMPIMGVTWILGVFSVSDDTVVFQYLFALFNSVQGVLIFVFHCVMNRKIQEAFRKKMSRWQSLRSYDFSKSFAHSMKSTQLTESTSAM